MTETQTVQNTDDVDSSGCFDREYNRDEFKLLYDSTIHVTEWRNAANRFYYSISVAIFIAIGAIFFFGYEQSSTTVMKTLSLFSASVVTVFGLFVARTWIQLLNYYYGLNRAKFDAMRNIDEQNVFEFEYSIFNQLKQDGVIKQIQARKVEKTAPYVALMAFVMSSIICLTLLVLTMIGSLDGTA